MKLRSVRNISSFALGAVLLCVSGTPDLAAAPQGATKKVPTTITSERMDYNAGDQTVLFLGDVHVKRPDFELWSKKMTVYLEKSGKGSEHSSQTASMGGMEAGDIDHIVAEENVRLKSESNTGTCDKATYYAKEDKFVMEGNPVLRDSKQSVISGKTVVHYLSSNRSQVIGGPGRGVSATFYSEDRTEEGGSPLPGPVLPGSGKNGNKKNGAGSDR